MAIYTNLPVFKDSYQLLLGFSQIAPNLPRDCRYTLGQELRSRLMEIMVLIYRANSTRAKQPVIARMRQLLVEAQVYLRLMNDLRYMADRHYLRLSEIAVGLSKQMAAWERSARNNNENGGGTAAAEG